VREEISVHSRWRHQRLDSLDEANQWTSVRATNAIKRLHKEFKRRTQAFLPNAESAAWTLLASAQIVTRKVGGWQNLFKRPFARIHRPRRMIRYPQTAGESLKINSNTNRAGIKYLTDQTSLYQEQDVPARKSVPQRPAGSGVRRKPRTGVQL
jgi:hypothetical protein